MFDRMFQQGEAVPYTQPGTSIIRRATVKEHLTSGYVLIDCPELGGLCEVHPDSLEDAPKS